MKMHALATLLAAAMLSFAAPARAAIIQVDHVLDPAKIGQPESLGSPFTAAVGDKVEFNVTFLGGPLTLTNESYIGFVALADSGASGIVADYGWEFISPSANLWPSRQSWQINEPDYLGVFLTSGEYRAASGPFSFAGIRLTMDLLSLYDIDTDGDGVSDAPAQDPRTYSSLVFHTNGDAVPEAATWMMLIAGLGATGIRLRSRQRSSQRSSMPCA